jgi:predicted transcriptional regulator
MIHEEARMSDEESSVIGMAADIVSAYIGNNTVSVNDLPNLIKNIHNALKGISTGTVETPASEKASPAVPLRKAVQPDYVVDLFTGKRFKSLKRHLRTVHNMTPEEYRAYWGLPKDSPMVAPNYAAARSALAKSMGLGQGGRQAAKPSAAAKTPAVRKPRAKKAEA